MICVSPNGTAWLNFFIHAHARVCLLLIPVYLSRSDAFHDWSNVSRIPRFVLPGFGSFSFDLSLFLSTVPIKTIRPKSFGNYFSSRDSHMYFEIRSFCWLDSRHLLVHFLPPLFWLKNPSEYSIIIMNDV